MALIFKRNSVILPKTFTYICVYMCVYMRVYTSIRTYPLKTGLTVFPFTVPTCTGFTVTTF